MSPIIMLFMHNTKGFLVHILSVSVNLYHKENIKKIIINGTERKIGEKKLKLLY